MPNTTKGYPYPQGSDAVDVPGDIQALADAVDASPGVTSYTSTQIAALTAGEKWAGRVIWNSTAGKLQVSNGSTFADVDAAVTPSGIGAIAAAIVDAKGDLVAATAADTPARLGVGADGTVLTAASGEATGLKWAAVGGGKDDADNIIAVQVFG